MRRFGNDIKLYGYILLAIVVVSFLLVEDINTLVIISLTSFILFIVLLGFYAGKLYKSSRATRNPKAAKINQSKSQNKNPSSIDFDKATELKDLLIAGIIDKEEYYQRLNSDN